ncbi:MAG: hypothetical protein P4M00_13540 [Azospirillaceae bacterium]|nr:hypothetical protein [Azospirillaceae bacterium]
MPIMPSAAGLDPRFIEMTKNGIVTVPHEKVPDPPGRHANGVVCFLDPEVIAALAKPNVNCGTESNAMPLGGIQILANRNYLRHIGTPESLQPMDQDFTGPNDVAVMPKQQDSSG